MYNSLVKAPVFKFDNPGDSIFGEIIADKEEPEPEFNLNGGPRKFKQYDDGNYQMQIVLTLQTNLRTLKDDDGQRRVYLRSLAKKAFGNCVQRANLRPRQENDFAAMQLSVAIEFIGYGKAKRGMSAPKLFRVSLWGGELPGKVTATSDGSGEGQQAAPPPRSQPAPQRQQRAPEPPPQDDVPLASDDDLPF